MQAANEATMSYALGAFQRDAIPDQAPLKDISGFAKSLEAGDFPDLEEQKKKRLHLKDQLYTMIREHEASVAG